MTLTKVEKKAVIAVNVKKAKESIEQIQAVLFELEDNDEPEESEVDIARGLSQQLSDIVGGSL